MKLTIAGFLLAALAKVAVADAATRTGPSGLCASCP
jgi:hypothetical protein